MFKCIFCNKFYKSQKCLRKHYIKCSIANNVNVLNCQTELFEMIRELINQNKNLKDRVEKLEKCTYKEKKKVNVIEWLNKNRKSNLYIERFIKGINIGEGELKMVYDMGIVEGIINILESKMGDEKPIMCFESRSYVLYVRDEKGWKQIKEEEFKKYILYIQREILKVFREKNPVDDLFTDREHNIYNKRLMSICIEKFIIKIKNIRNELYRKNKVNINKIVKYDFIF